MYVLWYVLSWSLCDLVVKVELSNVWNKWAKGSSKAVQSELRPRFICDHLLIIVSLTSVIISVRWRLRNWAAMSDLSFWREWEIKIPSIDPYIFLLGVIGGWSGKSSCDRASHTHTQTPQQIEDLQVVYYQRSSFTVHPSMAQFKDRWFQNTLHGQRKWFHWWRKN